MRRRDFMKTAALIAAGGVVSAARAHEGGKGAKVCLHLFSKPLQWLGVDRLVEVVAEAGYGGIDLTVRPGGHVKPEKAGTELPRVVEAARRQGLKIRMMTTSLTDPEDPAAERLLKTAAQCGIRIYRMGYLRYAGGRPMGEELERLRRVLAAFEQLNRSCGISGGYQNHRAWEERLFGGVLWDLHAALKGLDPQWIGSQYDVHHAVAETGGSWVAGMRLIAPHITSTCLKDYIWPAADKQRHQGVFAGEGLVPWKRYYELVKELRIGGPASVHCEWELFTKAEQALTEPERCAIAVRKLKRDSEFFTAQYANCGLTVE